MPFQPSYTSPNTILIVPVDCLKRRETKCPVIDSLRHERQAGSSAPIYASVPTAMSHHAKPMWVHEVQNRFSTSVANLLFQIRLYGLAAMVPHKCTRGITDAPPVVQQSPAKIHVISGCT